MSAPAAVTLAKGAADQPRRALHTELTPPMHRDLTPMDQRWSEE
ncbi:MAG: hypothetical protein AB1Z22_09685 [Synechococcaceae cyanobacterium]